MISAELEPVSPTGFKIRDATLNDVGDISRLWFLSFNQSHKFFEYATPENPEVRAWLEEIFVIGIKAGPSVFRTFVVEDVNMNHKLVAFCRIHVPQPDGSQEIPMPEFPDGYDPKIADGLWGGMERNRASIMGRQLHWMGEFLGVDPLYQGKSLVAPLMDWICRQGDETGLPIYLDATADALPIHKKRNGFTEVKPLVLKDPNTYGRFEVVAMVRLPKRPGFRSSL
ncbi:unnamed protein product [Clonostachys rhizophaga]|uniref:N-acetyltransferase domain-containing protein n=1 Tax=Clonostachys rhizophaga TaxID=160324 RepID=A0A9N9VK81_9HYPO|nr:unnamed protein product [Clonostachys rhizophaga]